LKSQLEQAKAAHQNTKSIEEQIAALNKQEKALGVEPGLISNVVSKIQELKLTSIGGGSYSAGGRSRLKSIGVRRSRPCRGVIAAPRLHH